MESKQFRTVTLDPETGKLIVSEKARPQKTIVLKKIMIPKSSSDGSTSMQPVLVSSSLASQKTADSDHDEEMQEVVLSEDVLYSTSGLPLELGFSDEEQEQSRKEDDSNEQNVTIISTKKSWTRKEAGALLACVLMAQGIGGPRTVKDIKFWKKVTQDLNKTLPSPVTYKQAKSKYDKMSGIYGKQRDWDDKDGSEPYSQHHRDALDDELFNLVADIKGHPKKGTKKFHLPREKKIIKTPQGSGSKSEGTNLEHQFLEHLKTMSELAFKEEPQTEKALELREIFTTYYSQYVEEMRWKEAQRKKEFEVELKEKNRRHAERMEIERERNKIEERRNVLLEKLLREVRNEAKN